MAGVISTGWFLLTLKWWYFSHFLTMTFVVMLIGIVSARHCQWIPAFVFIEKNQQQLISNNIHLETYYHKSGTTIYGWCGINPFLLNLKMVKFFLLLDINICWGAHWKRLSETLPMSSHNICFSREISKLISNYAPLGPCYYYHEAGTTIYGWCGFKPQNGDVLFKFLDKHLLWSSLEASHWDASNEQPQHMFK